MKKLTIGRKLRTLDVIGLDDNKEIEICMSHNIQMQALSIWLTKTEAKKLIKFIQTQINTR